MNQDYFKFKIILICRTVLHMTCITTAYDQRQSCGYEHDEACEVTET